MWARLSPITVAWLCVAGCASGSVNFNSTVNLTSFEPIKKLLILTNMKGTYVNDGIYSGFSLAMETRLAACGVDLDFFVINPMDLDPMAEMKKVLERFQPDVAMTIANDGGDVTTGSGGTSGTIYMNARASDERTKQRIWSARIGYSFLINNMFSDDLASGEKFGNDFVDRMVSDKILGTCPELPKKSSKAEKTRRT